MAYAGTSSVVFKTISGRRHAIITCSETEAAAASEWSIALGHPIWTLKSYKATLTAGTAASINPRLGRAASFVVSTQDHIATQGTTAAHIKNATAVPVVLSSTTPTLYVRSTVNAGADNSISTEIVLVEGLDT